MALERFESQIASTLLDEWLPSEPLQLGDTPADSRPNGLYFGFAANDTVIVMRAVTSRRSAETWTLFENSMVSYVRLIEIEDEAIALRLEQLFGSLFGQMVLTYEKRRGRLPGTKLDRDGAGTNSRGRRALVGTGAEEVTNGDGRRRGGRRKKE